MCSIAESSAVMYGNVRGPTIRVSSVDMEVDHDLLSARMREVLRHLRMGVDHDPIDMLEAVCEQLGVDVNETEPDSTRIARSIMRKNGINVGCQATPEEIFDILPLTTPMHNDGALSSPDDDSSTDTDYNHEEEDGEDGEEKKEQDLDLSLISSALTPRTGSNEHSGAGSSPSGRRRKASINSTQHQPLGSPQSKRNLFGSPFGPSTPQKMPSRANSNSSPQGQLSPSSVHSLSKAALTPPRFSTSAFFWGSSAKAMDVACLEGESMAERLGELEDCLSEIEATMHTLAGVDRRQHGLEKCPVQNLECRDSEIKVFKDELDCSEDQPPCGPPTSGANGSGTNGQPAAWPAPPAPMAASYNSTCRSEFGSAFGEGHMSMRLVSQLLNDSDAASPLSAAHSPIGSIDGRDGDGARRRRARLIRSGCQDAGIASERVREDSLSEIGR